MKVLPHMLLGVALLFAICSTFNTVHAQADSAEIDNGFFYDRLSPHGDWVNTTEHGWTWQPSDADGEFRPYTQGSWVYTDDSGWYWQSATEHGWATEHYGRWTKVDSKWNWVPGNEWSGGWVTWRNGGGHVGWAPLPPRAKWEAGSGIGTKDFNHETDIPKDSWVFVNHSSFTASNVHDVMITDSEANIAMRQAPVAGSVTDSRGKIVNQAITRDAVAKFTGQTIETRRLRNSDTLGGMSVKSEKGKNGESGDIRVFRPRVKNGDFTPPAKSDRQRISDASRKTMQERHAAEGKDLDERNKNSGRDDAQRKTDRDAMDKRHKQENDDFDKKNDKDSDTPRKDGEKPARNPVKGSDKDSGK